MRLTYFILVISFLYTGCDIFNARHAEEPNAPRSSFVPAVDEKILIENLIKSLFEKDVDNYLLCFSDTLNSSKKFHFSPSLEAVLKYPSLTTDWNLEEETQYFKNLINKTIKERPIVLTFSNVKTSSSQGDSIVFTAAYSLNVPHLETDLPENYEGEVRFYMLRDSRAIWTIYYWQDIKSTELPSWSELKGRFY